LSAIGTRRSVAMALKGVWEEDECKNFFNLGIISIFQNSM
jgi:hypothetical protein